MKQISWWLTIWVWLVKITMIGLKPLMRSPLSTESIRIKEVFSLTGWSVCCQVFEVAAFYHFCRQPSCGGVVKQADENLRDGAVFQRLTRGRALTAGHFWHTHLGVTALQTKGGIFMLLCKKRHTKNYFAKAVFFGVRQASHDADDLRTGVSKHRVRNTVLRYISPWISLHRTGAREVTGHDKASIISCVFIHKPEKTNFLNL